MCSFFFKKLASYHAYKNLTINKKVHHAFFELRAPKVVIKSVLAGHTYFSL